MYRDESLHLTKEPKPASDSPYLNCFQDGDLKSHLILAHIRQANPPEVGQLYSNTHPFARTVQGKTWVFAHNGKITNLDPFRSSSFTPNGETDSEQIFCWLLDQLAGTEVGKQSNDHENILDVLAPLVSRVNQEGEFNFFLSNGDWLIAHGHNRLHKLVRTCSKDGYRQRVILLASNPLSEERWSAISPNTLLLLRHGQVVKQYNSKDDAN